MAILDKVRKGFWNAFRHEERTRTNARMDIGPGYASRPDRTVTRFSSEKSIISSIYTRISVDVAAIDIRHVELDEKGRFKGYADSLLNKCFMVEANIDQAPRAFRQDIVLSLLDEGVAAIVPVDTLRDPNTDEVFDIKTLRVGGITQWYPRQVRVNLWNEDLGQRQEVTVSKRFTAIAENPLYAVMNEPNSTLKRLIRKLNLLDAVDEQSGSGRLDLIIQLPYSIRSESKKQQANQRREDIEWQLRGSQYGIAYTDATEKIVQLNRPANNNLLDQIKYLVDLLYAQLGLTPEVMNGTANEATMRNYHTRTVEPIITAIVEAMARAFVHDRPNETIMWFNNPFKLVPVKDLAEIADKFIRNRVMAPNELRGFMGLPPSDDPDADKLENPNMPSPEEETAKQEVEGTSQNAS